MPEPLVWTGLRYRAPSGRYISRVAVRRALEESLANLTRLTDTLADDLRAGRISLNQWREEMRETIKQVQMASAELAHGGRTQMTPADYGAVGQKVRTEYQHLENWVNEMKAGAPVDGRTEQRAKLYLRSGRTAFVKAEADVMREAGYLARSVTRPAEHCAECLAEEAKGLVEVQYLVPPGMRTCLGNCKCVLVYERVA